jgi:hypothetical protein
MCFVPVALLMRRAQNASQIAILKRRSDVMMCDYTRHRRVEGGKDLAAYVDFNNCISVRPWLLLCCTLLANNAL